MADDNVNGEHRGCRLTLADLEAIGALGGSVSAADLAALGVARWIGPVKTNCFAGQSLLDNVFGTVAGGTFTVTHDGDTTPALAWNVSAANMKAALEALPSVGAGNVISVDGVDVNTAYAILFRGVVAQELLSTDSSNLTGPDAPYTVAGIGNSNGWSVPLVTLAAGDMFEDLFVTVPQNFNGTPTLLFSDDATDSSTGQPVWCPFKNDVTFDLSIGNLTYTNFLASGNADIGGASTAQQVILGDEITNTALLSSLLPAIASQAVTVYAHLNGTTETPTDGEVWIYSKVATPSAS